jgi:hypothetical protein
MTLSRSRRGLAIAGVVVAAALGSAGTAQADPSAEHCDVRLDRLEAQFYDMADRRSYEAAAEWWDARWHAYHTSCVI